MPSAARGRALVTGGAKRLGAAFALDLARQGWDVWIHYHTSEEAARGLSQQIQSMGRKSWLVQADLSLAGGAEALVNAVETAPPALIVHSASVWNQDTLLDASAASWEASHRLHVWSAVVLARALSRWQGTDRHLVNLLDGRLRDRDPGHFSYAFGKRELAMMTRYLASELAPGVRVNGLAPGLVLRADATNEIDWNKIGLENTPLGRTGRTEELLASLRYLTDTTFVTGQILTVDGGRHLKGDLFGSL